MTWRRRGTRWGHEISQRMLGVAQGGVVAFVLPVGSLIFALRGALLATFALKSLEPNANETR